MTDLKAFTSDLLADMERDLATKLDWVAVEHWNTDNPHVRLLARGKAEDGKDLVISRDYITRGIRARAEDLVGNYAARSSVDACLVWLRGHRPTVRRSAHAIQRPSGGIRPRTNPESKPYRSRPLPRYGRCDNTRRSDAPTRARPVQE